MKTTADPDGMNDKRAAWADAAISAFIGEVNTDREDVLSDLLADLRHWADRNGFNFDDENARGRQHYDDEIQEPEEVQS